MNLVKGDRVMITLSQPIAKKRFIFWSAAVVAICAAGFAAPAIAGPFNGSVSGVFSLPALSGQLEDGATGVFTPENNAGTAACSLVGCTAPLLPGDPAKNVNWGTGAFAIPTSTLTFTGTPIVNQAPDTVFQIGQFTYTNGTSDLTSLIFGATLTLTLNDTFGGVIDTKVVKLVITTTNNTGNAAQNADFVQFPATSTTLQSQPSMNVFEGSTATFLLMGEIIGDPTLSLAEIVIAPGSEGAGFVGQGRPVPEPASIAMLIVGLAGLSFARARARG
jgi:hypothetical protein